MPLDQSKQYAIKVDLLGRAITETEIELNKSQLKSVYRDYLNYMLALIVLAAGVSYRAFSLEYEQISKLFEIGIYIGFWMGLFTGFMSSGDQKRRLHLILVSIIVSTAAGLFASMLVTLFVSYTTSWISSITILASALACMWVLTHYEELIVGFDSLKFASAKQAKLLGQAAARFPELEGFQQQIEEQGRPLLLGEYWAVQDWLEVHKNK